MPIPAPFQNFHQIKNQIKGSNRLSNKIPDFKEFDVFVLADLLSDRPWKILCFPFSSLSMILGKAKQYLKRLRF
jgi:hypothetical protein